MSDVVASWTRFVGDSVHGMKRRGVTVATCSLLVAGLGIAYPVSAGAAAKPPASPTVWFLTNEDRVGRVQPGAQPKVYDNPLRCAVGEDDCNLRGIAATPGALWIPDATNGLRRIDPATGRPANAKNGDRYSSAPIVFDSRLWFTDVDRLLGVRPPATGIATKLTFSKTYAEALANSPHFLWIAGSGQTRSAPAGVRRMDRAGHVQDIDLPISGDLSVVIGALDDETAYVVASPTSPEPSPPSRLFRIAVTSGGTRVDDLGALTFDPGAIVAVGNHLWLNDVNAPRLVALTLDGHPTGQTDLTVPGDGQLVGASGRLWFVGSPESGPSVVDVVDPASGSVLSTTPVTLPGTDRIGAFTIAG